MQVKATQRGYFGGRIIERGETFAITDEKQFSDEWMAKVEAEKPAHAKGGPAAK
jgi:hypothetical protein